jgi:Na+/melibiose symporter-like transporter
MTRLLSPPESEGIAMAKSLIGGPTKLAYGVGLSAEGVKTNAFNVFLLFFYQQVVGLDPALCGLALFLSLCVDAFVDPFIGAWSDRFSSRLGRRHPFMYAGIVPLALCFHAVFTPPLGLGTGGKFAWLLAFAIGARVAMALFVIPHQSLVPEVTRDPGERASLMSLRMVFGWLFALLNGLLGYTVFLRRGLSVRDGYAPFATFGAVTMMVTMTICAVATQRVAKEASAAAPASHAPFSFLEMPRALFAAMRNASYRAVVVAGLFLAVGYGIADNMNNYMNTFFWGFSSDQIGRFIVVIFFAALSVLFLARRLVQRFETHHVALGAAAVMTVLMPGLVSLRLLGVLPEPGDPRLFHVLSVGVFFLYGSIILGMSLMGAMVASVTDEHESVTGKREEGLLFSSAMFISKAASGLGVLAAGLVVKIVGFPENAKPGSVDPATIRHLGMGSACASLLFGATTVYCFSRFKLTRERHAQILEEVEARRRLGAASAES